MNHRDPLSNPDPPAPGFGFSKGVVPRGCKGHRPLRATKHGSGGGGSGQELRDCAIDRTRRPTRRDPDTETGRAGAGKEGLARPRHAEKGVVRRDVSENRASAQRSTRRSPRVGQPTLTHRK